MGRYRPIPFVQVAHEIERFELFLSPCLSHSHSLYFSEFSQFKNFILSLIKLVFSSTMLTSLIKLMTLKKLKNYAMNVLVNTDKNKVNNDKIFKEQNFSANFEKLLQSQRSRKNKHFHINSIETNLLEIDIPLIAGFRV